MHVSVLRVHEPLGMTSFFREILGRATVPLAPPVTTPMPLAISLLVECPALWGSGSELQ